LELSLASVDVLIFRKDVPDLSRTKGFYRVFYKYNYTTINNINNWNVSSVTSFNGAFSNSYFNSPLNHWDVSSVTDFSSMFISANQFNGDISSWNTKSATSMNTMFYAAHNFNNDISNWNVSSVQDFSYVLLHILHLISLHLQYNLFVPL
jgi:surface protein